MHHERKKSGSKRDGTPSAVDTLSQSEDDLLSLIDHFRFGPGAISSPPRFSSKNAERKRSISGSGVSPKAQSNVIGTLNGNSLDIHNVRKNADKMPMDLASDTPTRSIPSTGSNTPTSTSSYVNDSFVYNNSGSPSPTSRRKKQTHMEKGAAKRRPSPITSRPLTPHLPNGPTDNDALEIVGQGPKNIKPVSAFVNVREAGSSGGSRMREEGGVEVINLLQDLIHNKISDAEFANVVENQSSENRWVSIRDLAAQVKRLTTLLTFSNSISSELDLDKSSEKMSQLVCEILSADRASLYLIEEGKEMLVSKSALSRDGKAEAMHEIRVPMGAGIVGHVAKHGKMLNVRDTSEEPLFFCDVDKATGYITKTILCMPVVDEEGGVVAVVEAINKQRPGSALIEAFDFEDERVMRTLAQHAAISLRNSQLYQSSVLAQRRIQVLLEVASQLASELETTSLITQIMTKARDLLDADRCTLFLLDKERGELWSKVAEGSKEIRVPATKGIAGHVATTGEILNIKDAYQDSRFNPEIDKRTGYRTKSILCMPLKNTKQDIIGVTQMINKKDGGVFQDQDEQLLKAFSSQAAVSLENAKLFAKTNEMRNYLQSILQSITNLVLSLDLEGRFFSSNHPTEKFLGVSEQDMRASTYQVWLGEANKTLADHITAVIKDPGKIIEKTDYELVVRAASAGGTAGKLSINYKVVPLVDTTNHVFQGVVVVIEDVTPQKRMMSTLNRYMSPALAEQVVKEGGDRLGGVHLTVSTLFADIRNFTPMSEGMDAAEVVGMLNEYFSYMVGVVFDEGGVLDKYIGDAMMAVFGVPFPAPDDPHKACRAALEMLRRLVVFNAKRKEKGEPQVFIGIGINTGKVLSGNIGSEKRLEYTVIGDGVNLASRIEGITKSYGVRVLLSEFTQQEVSQDFITREIDSIRVVGKTKPVKIYELLGKTEDEVAPALVKMLPTYHSALSLYRQRKFDESLVLFQMVAKEASDFPSAIFAKRCEQMLIEPPGPNWTGVFDFVTK